MATFGSGKTAVGITVDEAKALRKLCVSAQELRGMASEEDESWREKKPGAWELPKGKSNTPMEIRTWARNRRKHLCKSPSR